MYPVRPLSPENIGQHCGKMVCAVMKDGRRFVGRLHSCNGTHIFLTDERKSKYRSCRAYKSSVLESKQAEQPKKKQKKLKKQAVVKGFYPYGGYGYDWALGLSFLALLFLI
ncbi:hypothetical protein PUW24_03405 [Paenibacillus urinalis]|uniref:Uncharacterized protein n=1 Tax=Paenibacillus urinalis TaxID=521520 RepID=A0AAX3MXJ6_9BACL|nr:MULTISPECIES: hypothetical protein [Paenibacillus]WDH81992.1 hypothetical protein PUW23_21250 [Paenibacillus urinalis]WDH98039.1 hypothetical protein PUW24_03405 [Paenibacillus urinalis]WDI01721.1 hypothetical protein PUW25_21140 [Paenibacillus urinalis]